jgi:acetolactate synthase-1/2/3 large subunit
MLLLVGQVPRGFRGREAWQELDYGQAFGAIAKAAWEVDAAERIPEHLARAFTLALSGRPGPVVLSLPEDVLSEEADVPDAAPPRIEHAAPRPEDLAQLAELLAAAERPLVVVGEGGWTAGTGADVLAFCEANDLPVAASFRCQDFVDNRSRCYVGVLGVAMDDRLAARLRDADLVLAIGGRLGEVPTRRYTLLEPPSPTQTLIHVHPDPNELGLVYEPSLAITSSLPVFAAALRDLGARAPRWQDWARDARADYEANLRSEPMEGPVDLGAVMGFLRERLPADAIQTTGAGNFTVWAHRFAEFARYGTQLCPRSGSMGYGIAAAVAAKLVHPDRIALCFTGDGDFVMSSPELATAVQHELPIVILLVNNGMYATIRMHQERVFPGRVVGTDLVNPDFPALARAYGAHGERVERTEDFEAAFERALAAGKAALLELPVDPERISPRVKLSELQAAAR